jgi:hypothetical protein
MSLPQSFDINEKFGKGMSTLRLVRHYSFQDIIGQIEGNAKGTTLAHLQIVFKDKYVCFFISLFAHLSRILPWLKFHGMSDREAENFADQMARCVIEFSCCDYVILLLTG